jgi:hypothetical protein
MIRCYLDETEVDPPVGLDGLTLVKSRHRRYWGFLYRKLGFVSGSVSLDFADLDAQAILRTAYAQQGVQAQTRIRFTDDNLIEPLYDGFVDYAQSGWTKNAFSVALRDDQATADLEAAVTTIYSYSATTSAILHGLRLNGAAQFIVNPNRSIVSTTVKNADYLSHTVPLVRRNENDQLVPGELFDITAPSQATGLSYRNTTGKDQFIRLSGLLQANVLAAANTTATLRVRVRNASGVIDPAREVVVGRYAVNTVSTPLTAAINVGVVVPSGYGLNIQFTADTALNSLVFSYTSATQVSISDDTPIRESSVRGLLAGELLSKLVSSASQGQLSLRSEYFTAAAGADLLITNGSLLRGVNRPLSCSLQSLFEGLNALFNLELTLEDNQVRIEPKAALQAEGGLTSLGELFSLSEKPATNFLYNQVLSGYKTYQSDSLQSALEPNGERSYTTGITAVRNPLDLRSELIASGTLIEETRQKQFDAETSGAGKTESLDDALFVICLTKKGGEWHNERLERVSSLGDLTDGRNAYNLRLSPRRNLLRWLDWLTGSLPLTSETSSTQRVVSYRYDGLLMEESAGIASTDTYRPVLATLEASMSMIDYARLTDWVRLPDGRQGLLLDASWRKTTMGNTATLALLL